MAQPKRIVHAKYLWPDNYVAFNTWQRKQPEKVSPHKHFVSSAEEYHRYMNRPASSRGLSISNLANFFWRVEEPKKPSCGHQRHPSAAAESFCPVCQVQHCIEFLDAITQAWENVGGPFRESPEPRSTHNDYGYLKLAWRSARLDLVNLVSRLEHKAILENRLDSYAPATSNVDMTAPVHGARAALDWFYQHYKYPIENAPANTEQEQPARENSRSSPKEHRKVHFPNHLSDGPVRRNTLFKRNHNRYIAGRHAASRGAEFENTTLNDDTEFLLRQCKVFFTADLDFRAYAQKPEHWLEFEGIAGSHPRWEEILAGLVTFLQWRSLPRCREWVKELETGGTDGVAIVMDGERIVDFVPLRAPRGKEEVVKRKASWVSLSDVQI